jgi:hypothetical protein
MARTNGAGLATAAADGEARMVVPAGEPDKQPSKHPSRITQDRFRRLGEVVAQGRAPVLILARSLIAAGLNPDEAIAVHSGAVHRTETQEIFAALAKILVSSGTRNPARWRANRKKDSK